MIDRGTPQSKAIHRAPVPYGAVENLESPPQIAPSRAVSFATARPTFLRYVCAVSAFRRAKGLYSFYAKALRVGRCAVDAFGY